MPPTLNEAFQEALMLDARTLTESLQDAASGLTGGLQDPPRLTGGLQDGSTLTGGLQAPSPATEGEPRVFRLTDEMRAFIVRGLARYETPSQVAAAVHATYGIQISRQLVYKYDPTGTHTPAERWIELHAVTRAKFLADLSEIGVAQKVVRLRMLDRFVQEADEDNHCIKAAAFLEQAAKECGGIYEKRQAALPARQRRRANNSTRRPDFES